MPDETTPAEVPATTGGNESPTPAAGTPPAAPPVEPSPAPPAATPNWMDELNTVDAKELRKHPKIAGIIGSENQRAIQREQERIKAEEGARAARQAEQELEELAQSDPVTFAERYMTEKQKRDVQRQLDDLKGNTRKEFAESVGRAYRDLPEWSELTEGDYEALATALTGKDDDEVIPLFAQQALSIVAERRAQKKLADWKKTELAKEREAIRQEEAAKLLKTGEPPDTTPPKNLPAKVNIKNMSDEEFDMYWKKLPK